MPPHTSPAASCSATAAAWRAHEPLASAVAAHPGGLAGPATLPPGPPRQAAEELERAVGDLGLVGGMIHSTLGTNNTFLDDARFEPLLSAFEELDVPLYLHPATAPQQVADVLFGGLKPAVAGRLATNSG